MAANTRSTRRKREAGMFEANCRILAMLVPIIFLYIGFIKQCVECVCAHHFPLMLSVDAMPPCSYERCHKQF